MRSPDSRTPGDPRSQARSALFGEGAAAPALAENPRAWFPEIIGRSPALRSVLETVAKVARSDGAVLILGESGTGKELIASAVHRLSNRSDRPYITVNSSAIPENLLESELFGHEKGAFTSAHTKRIGRFEEAHSGTLFLDEIGDMPMSLQSKLLRVLQDKKYSPLGGNETREADVRIIAATNMNLKDSLNKTFRLDLYHRLNVFPITLPALRHRSEDVADLIEHFTEISNRSKGVSTPCFFTPEAIQILSTYDWPGNIRQLQNMVERMVVMRGNEGGGIMPADLDAEILIAPTMRTPEISTVAAPAPTYTPHPTSMPIPPLHAGAAPRFPESFGKLPSEGLDLVQFIESLENDFIRQALERTGNNRNQAAKLLGLNRTTLVERIKKRRLTTLNEPSKEL